MRPTIYDAIKNLLIDRGWKIDENAIENTSGEVHEFIHPETGKARAWLDAIGAEQEKEIR